MIFHIKHNLYFIGDISTIQHFQFICLILQTIKMNNFETTDTSSTSSSDENEVVFIRRPKVYKERRNYFDILDDVEFFNRFRLTKQTVENILQQINHSIRLPTNRYVQYLCIYIFYIYINKNFRGGCISPMHQLLLTLRFYALGDMQIAVADFIGISKTSACRIISKVSRAIASLNPQYIKMPTTREEMERTAQEFYNIASFPRVIGAIDCTLIKIDSPGGHDAEIFRCRKSYFALNVQTVSDAKLKIRNVVVRWPGSTHDQTIFNNSSLKRAFENGNFGRYLLIGDSGYSLQSYLMTKLIETRTAAENLYNESIIRTRNTVERQYGVWKRRFPILKLGMRMKLETIMNVIVATAVLHNVALDMNEEIPENWNEVDVEEVQNEEPANNMIPGRHTRQLIINEHFARLL